MSGTFAPTVEQQAILAAYRAGGSLLIEAGAGTGKTTTLRLLADHDPGKVLYLAYNKATSAEAKRKFPRNVTVSTAHAFALRQLRTANSSMAAAVIERLNAARMPNSQMARQLGVLMPLDLGPDRRPLQPPAQIGLAKETLKRWCWSADDQIAARHVPPLEGVEPSVVRVIAPHLVKLAERLWADATAPGGQYKTDHDYYLKLFQLMRGEWGFDTVLLDESQDSNGVVLAMLQHQQATGTRLVAVGDRFQTLYKWRGSIDAMDKLDLPTRLPLTQSFRFGPAVADEANLWLAALGTKTRISGTPSISSQVGPLHANPDAVLCRTNAATIGAVIEYQASGVPVALVGGGLEVRQLAAAAEELQTTGRTWHPDLLAFTSWGQVQDYVEHDGGSELATFVKLIDSYGAAGIMRAVDDCVSEDRAAVTVSTAHKAKGREWSRVKVGSDFPQPMPPDPAPEDLMMLAYVTVTRARHHLDAGSLAWIGQYLDLHNIPRPAPSGYTPTPPATPSPVPAQPATPTAGDEETSKPVPGPLAFVQQPTTPPPAAGETAPSTPAVQAQPALFAGPEPLPSQPQVIVPVALTGKTLRVLTRWAAAANRPLDDAIGHALDMLADTLDQTT